MAPLPHGIRRAFRLALRRPRIEEEVDAEIAFHLEMRAAELAARGMTPEAARAEALRRFGDTHQWSEAMSAVDRERAEGDRRAEWLDDLRQDLRYGARSLRRAPLFTLLAVVTLAFGIGANAAVFGVVKSVLLDALPYREPERLVRVYGRMLDGTVERFSLSAGSVADIVERARSFEHAGAFTAAPWDAVFAGDDRPRTVKVQWIEPRALRALGVAPVVGRGLLDEDTVGDTARAVLLTHAGWRRLLGGDPGAVGRSVRINGLPRDVVGILPRGFVGPAGEVDLYAPLSLASTLRNPVRARGSHWLGLVGRLRPGVTVDAARREVAAVGAELARAHPKDNGNIGMSVVPMHEAMVGDVRTPLLLLMASAGLVLLITCANLAGALLSRTIARRREFAVRLALGAGRGRLVRQLLTESVVLAAAGGLAGLALAWLGLGALRELAPDTLLPPHAELSLDRGAVLVTALVALATGVGFGLVPALSAGRADLQGTLRDESRGASEGLRARRLRGLLVAGQIALCVSLLSGAGLLARSLWAMSTRPLGFAPEGVLTVRVPLPSASYRTPEQAQRAFGLLEERLRALPGVTAVANAGEMPLPGMGANEMAIEGVSWPKDTPPWIAYTNVSDDYFRTLRIPLLRGRTFGPAESEGGATSIVINESMARKYWPNGNELGARIRLGPNRTAPWAVVVGVVGDVRIDPAGTEPASITYVSMRQDSWDSRVVFVRTSGDPAALAGAFRRELAAVDPSIPMEDARPLAAVLSDSLAGRRFPVVLMTAFGALALLLASVGVYAMFASMGAAREREFGIRVALGASPRGIALAVLGQGGLWMAVGLLAGAAGVVVVSRALRGLLYGTSPFDPVALGAAVALLAACGTAALLGPVRRATRVDPIAVLR